MKRPTPETVAPGASSGELKDLDYELFFVGVSVLSAVNILIILVAWDDVIRRIARIADTGLALLYLFDFGYRLKTAAHRGAYMTRQFGWADLLAVVPVPGFQLFRLVRSLRTLLLIRGASPRTVRALYRQDRARTTLLSVLLLIAYVIELGSMGVVLAERGHAGANILTAGDALWWSYVTISTVGFGDRYPITPLGRVVGVVMLTAGVGLFSVLTGFLANSFLAPRRRRMQAIEDERDAQSRALREVVRLLEEHEQRMAELRAQIADLERAQAEPAPGRDRPQG